MTTGARGSSNTALSLPPVTTPEQLRAFLARPWDRLRELKDRHNMETVQREGVEAAFRMAEALREHAELMGAVPTAEDRAEDLAAAVRLKQLLDRAGRRLQGTR